MAMKGLFQSNLGRKEEGLELVRQALKLNLKSHVCWHVYGLLYRADRNYEEALKCFRNALRFHPDNSQIMRDLAVLQTQMRQYAALCETRYHLLVLRPALKMSWIGLAVAYHLDGHHQQAVGVIDALLEGFPPAEHNTDQHMHAELALYKSMILEESGSLSAALSTISSDQISSTLGSEVRGKRAALLFSLGRVSDSLEIYSEWLSSNPDSKEALNGHVKCHQAIDPSRTAFHLVQDLLEIHPASLLLRSALLGLAKVDDLCALLVHHVLPMIKRGIPNSFSLVRNMYRQGERRPALTAFMELLIKEIDATPSTCPSLCWLRVMVAQHFSLNGEHDVAVAHMEAAAQAGSGLLPEFFLYYAKILRRAQCLDKAAVCMDKARRLDLSDRSLNSVAVKYWLRAGQIEQAKELATLFLKKNDMDTQLKDLVEMQAIWFSHEVGLAFQKKGDHVKAIEYFGHVLKHFEDFYQDQYDFHNYALRNSNLRSYINMVRYEDAIAGHPLFIKAAKAAIESLLFLNSDLSMAVESLSLEKSPRPNYLHLARIWTDRLLTYRAQDPESHWLAFKVFVAQSEHTLAARSIYQAQKLARHISWQLSVEARSFMHMLGSAPHCSSPEAIAFVELWAIAEDQIVKDQDAKASSHPAPAAALSTPILDSLVT